MNRWRIARLVAGKDLRVERRSRVVVNQVLPFAAVTMLMFAFALDATNVLERIAPGLVWLATLFSLLVLVQRAFAIEADDGALDTLGWRGSIRSPSTGVRRWRWRPSSPCSSCCCSSPPCCCTALTCPPAGLALLAVTLVLTTAGLACVGTLYGGLTAGFTGRETLLPLLVLPVVAPVLIGATRAVESALGTDGAALSEGWPWVGLLAVFAVAFGVGGALAFGPLIEEAT